ncbi:MAG: hypothetical protein P1P90_03295 [Patescibacteria group bacterium]|nr:hypothetical protein [Patescibacteria group bacterium]
MYKQFIVFFSLFALLAGFTPAQAQTALQAGDLIKGSTQAVYYYHTDGKRYVFPTEKTYFSWYSNFDDVKIISDEQLGEITIGGNVTYSPNKVMLKITTDPRVYVVSFGGVLRHIDSEALATELYGDDWAKKIHDLPDAFFINYNVGEPLTHIDQFIGGSIYSISKELASRGSSPSIVMPTGDYTYDKATGEIKRSSDDSVFFINPKHTHELAADSIVWYIQGIKDNQLIVWETGYDNSPGPCFNPFASEDNTFYAIDLADPNNWAGYYPTDLEKEIGNLEIDACTQSI